MSIPQEFGWEVEARPEDIGRASRVCVKVLYDNYWLRHSLGHRERPFICEVRVRERNGVTLVCASRWERKVGEA